MGINKRNAKVHFFKFSSLYEKNKNKFNEKLVELYTDFKNKEYQKIPNVEFDSKDDNSVTEVYYVQAIQKRKLEDAAISGYFYWLITISKVNVGEEITVANVSEEIDKRRRNVNQGKNEGVIKDSWIIYDPWKSVMLTYTPRGAVNRYEIKRFLNKLAETRGLSYEAIMSKDGYERFTNFSSINEVTYKLASPDNFKAFKDESRSENKDLQFASEMSSSKLLITLTDDKLSKDLILKKVKEVFANESLKVEKMQIDGINDGVSDHIDFVKNLLVYEGNIEYDNDFNDQAVFGFLNKAYDEHDEYLKKIFNAELKERENYEKGKDKEK